MYLNEVNRLFVQGRDGAVAERGVAMSTVTLIDIHPARASLSVEKFYELRPGACNSPLSVSIGRE